MTTPADLSRERLLEIVHDVRADCEADAEKIDRTPFTSRGLGERFGETLALIHGLAGVVEALVEQLMPPSNTGYASGQMGSPATLPEPIPPGDDKVERVAEHWNGQA